MRARPILKWAGGKTQLLPHILPLFPEKIRTYYEPFFGGGAVFFALADEKRFKQAIINDWNGELINLYSVVRDCPEELISHLAVAAQSYHQNGSEETFRAYRSLAPANLNPIEQAARTIFLNKTCFNGLYRQNKKGVFNVPWGKYKNPPICDEDNIRACSKVFQDIHYFYTGDFAPAIAEAGPGDLVYFDPPYLPLTATANFSAYTSDGFSLDDHYRLAAAFKELVDRGVTCVLSNHDIEVVRAMFEGFEIIKVDAKRHINSKGDKRGAVGEVLVVGRPKLAETTYSFPTAT